MRTDTKHKITQLERSVGDKIQRELIMQQHETSTITSTKGYHLRQQYNEKIVIRERKSEKQTQSPLDIPTITQGKKWCTEK